MVGQGGGRRETVSLILGAQGGHSNHPQPPPHRAVVVTRSPAHAIPHTALAGRAAWKGGGQRGKVAAGSPRPGRSRLPGARPAAARTRRRHRWPPRGWDCCRGCRCRCQGSRSSARRPDDSWPGRGRPDGGEGGRGRAQRGDGTARRRPRPADTRSPRMSHGRARQPAPTQRAGAMGRRRAEGGGWREGEGGQYYDEGVGRVMDGGIGRWSEGCVGARVCGRLGPWGKKDHHSLLYCGERASQSAATAGWPAKQNGHPVTHSVCGIGRIREDSG